MRSVHESLVERGRPASFAHFRWIGRGPVSRQTSGADAHPTRWNFGRDDSRSEEGLSQEDLAAEGAGLSGFPLGKSNAPVFPWRIVPRGHSACLTLHQRLSPQKYSESTPDFPSGKFYRERSETALFRGFEAIRGLPGRSIGRFSRTMLCLGGLSPIPLGRGEPAPIRSGRRAQARLREL